MTARSIKHKFASAKSDGADGTQVQASNWNADHNLFWGVDDARTGATDTVADSDNGTVIVYNRSSAIAVTLPQAGASSTFILGWSCQMLNVGAGSVTVTPTTSTINGASTLTIAQNQVAFIVSNGTNYRAWVVQISVPSGVSLPSVAKSGDYTTVSGDVSKTIAVTTGSSADVTITLLSAATAGDGAIQAIAKVDSGSKKTIVSDGSTRAWLSTQWDFIAFRSDGTNWNPIIISIAPRVDTYTSSSTWTKPPLPAAYHAEVWGGGGGGGSGCRRAQGDIKQGGAGGGGGAYYHRWFQPGDLSSTETVTVGAAGTAGAAVTANATNGNAGGDGGTSSFGTTVKLQCGGGKGGGAGNNSTVSTAAGGSLWASSVVSASGAAALAFEGAHSAGGAAGLCAIFGGAGGGAPNLSTANAGGSSAFGGGGGGGGGSSDDIDTFYLASAGGSTNSLTAGGGGAAGTSSSGTSTVGTAGSAIGVGGGGGGGGQTVTGKAGGAGGIGAGGGGGGSSYNGLNSGAGGLGGTGQVQVTTFFMSM